MAGSQHAVDGGPRTGARLEVDAPSRAVTTPPERGGSSGGWASTSMGCIWKSDSMRLDFCEAEFHGADTSLLISTAHPASGFPEDSFQ